LSREIFNFFKIFLPSRIFLSEKGLQNFPPAHRDATLHSPEAFFMNFVRRFSFYLLPILAVALQISCFSVTQL